MEVDVSTSGIDICYLLSHGFAARMILQTDVMQEIRQRGLSVAVVVPSQAESVARDIRERYGLSVLTAPDYENAYRREYQILRRYMFEDVRQNPALWPKHCWSKKSSRIRGLVLDSYLGLNKLSLRSSAFRGGLAKLESTLLRSRDAERMLAEIRPKVVVATYPVSRLESHFVHEAARMGITTVGHLLSWDNITSKGRFPSPPDCYITWGPVMSDEVKEYYGNADESIYECGVAHFDCHLEPLKRDELDSLLAQLGLDPQRPYLLFGMSSEFVTPREVDVVTWLANAVNSNRFGQDMQLVIRPHPQNMKPGGPDSWASRISVLAGSRVAINYPDVKSGGLEWNLEESDLDQLVALFGGSSVTLSSGSTFAIDGLMRDKPVIITAFDADARLPWFESVERILSFHHLRKLIDFGGCYVASSFESLASGIDRYLADPSADSEGRAAARTGECGQCDGRTAERIALALEDIVLRTSGGGLAGRVAEEHAVR